VVSYRSPLLGPQVSSTRVRKPEEPIELSILPNPFFGSAVVELQLAQESRVAVEIYDLSGRLVESLANGAFGAGAHRFVWNGENDSGSDVPSGVYVCRGNFQDRVKATKVVLAR
jgi:flagellar hook assembly protein FlgD